MFYAFLEKEDLQLAQFLEELELAVFQNPRALLTHSRTLIEIIFQKIDKVEGIERPYGFKLIDHLNDQDVYEMPQHILDACHAIRVEGNRATHQIEQVYLVQSLTVWRHIYDVMRWYMETYLSPDLEMPPYRDPKTHDALRTLEIGELTLRLEQLEKQWQDGTDLTEVAPVERGVILPGMTTVRTLTFREESIDIPYFLRDALLLPQRFEKSESYLIALNNKQEARFMSELPYSLDDLHTRTPRRKQEHTAVFVEELKYFIEEEIRRKQVRAERQGDGELLLFYEGEQLVITESRAAISIDDELLPRSPKLIEHLQRDGITSVGLLPKEFVLIGKYDQIGPQRVRDFWEILKKTE